MNKFSAVKETELELISILDEMDKIAQALDDMEKYKDIYTDIEFTAKTRVYLRMYEEDAYDAAILKSKLSRAIRFKVWCSRWLKRLLKVQKQKNKK